MTARDMVLMPGCSLDGAGLEYGRSTLAVLEALGKPIGVLEDWNCCGASAARSTKPALSARLSARNLALAAAQGCDVIVNCAACYNNLSHSQSYLRDHPNEWSEADTGQPAPVESTSVYHLITVLTTEEMLERLRRQIVRPLDDMLLACYYGCLLTRPGGYTYADDPENPGLMEKLVELCGAKTVDWSYKTDCCGGSFSLTEPEAALELMGRLFTAAGEQDATAMVTACPLCQMNLDALQRQVGKAIGRELSLPIYYFTELLALAMDLDGVEKWFKGHMTKIAPAARKCR